MGFLNETGGNLRALWVNLSFAVRCSATLAAVAILATAVWWSHRTPETAHTVLFPEQPLAPSELVAMEAAFGRARLNGARLVDGHFEVPADRKDDYVRALLDHHALPATPASFSERLIAQDNLFTSPRQREALMKLAKEREISLMVRQIAGIAEATVHYEDVEGDGFPRRKSRRATVAVRSRATQPLAPQLIHAIRTTVANSLGIDPAGHIAVLDLNEGVAYTDSSASPRTATDARTPSDTPRVAPTSRKDSNARDGERSHEPTGPIKLANFETPDANSNSPPHIAAPVDVAAPIESANKSVNKSVAEPVAKPSDSSGESSRRSSAGTANRKQSVTPSEPPAADAAEPRLLPMSILRMVRPADNTRPAGSLAPRATAPDDANGWSIWLRDHGPTAGGLAGGLGVLGWLLRALLSVNWASHVEPTRISARIAPAGHTEPREELASDATLTQPTSAPPDARRELSDRVRDDASTAAAKLRQWLGHAA